VRYDPHRRRKLKHALEKGSWMKYLPLIWAGIWRKKLRTLFTFLSIVVAFVLFGILQGVDAGLAHITELQRLDRLFTVSRFGIPLPMADLSEIEAVPGVKLVAPELGLGGYWQDPKNGLGIVAVDERWFAAFPEASLTTGQLQSWARTRTGALVSAACADIYGWKVGNRISLMTTLPQKDGSKIWTFDVLAVLSLEGHEADRFILAHYKYLDEARAEGAGTLNAFIVRVGTAADAGRVSQAIDALYSTSGASTRTFSERANGQSQQNTNFNATFFTKTVVGAAFFTLLFLTANTMMQSVRERIPEFAVLKTLGYSDLTLLVMVLAEAVLVTVIGAALGLALAALLMPLAKNTIGIAHIRPVVFADGALVALLVGAVSAAAPAWRAKRLNVVDALAER
jgi:putative ABC transport system permease protein